MEKSTLLQTYKIRKNSINLIGYRFGNNFHNHNAERNRPIVRRKFWVILLGKQTYKCVVDITRTSHVIENSKHIINNIWTNSFPLRFMKRVVSPAGVALLFICLMAKPTSAAVKSDSAKYIPCSASQVLLMNLGLTN